MITTEVLEDQYCLICYDLLNSMCDTPHVLYYECDKCVSVIITRLVPPMVG